LERMLAVNEISAMVFLQNTFEHIICDVLLTLQNLF